MVSLQVETMKLLHACNDLPARAIIASGPTSIAGTWYPSLRNAPRKKLRMVSLSNT
jgi:hypothetical protein